MISINTFKLITLIMSDSDNEYISLSAYLRAVQKVMITLTLRENVFVAKGLCTEYHCLTYLSTIQLIPS